MTVRVLHVRIEGLTASFRHPLVISGTQAVLPVPTYSSLLGMLSACAGRPVTPVETRLGFEYRFSGTDFDFQTTQRWTLEQGRLREHRKGPGIMRRQFHTRPRLDVYVTATNLRAEIDAPCAAPCLGRSEDIAWISLVREIELTPVHTGAVGPTLIAEGMTNAMGLPLTLAEWFQLGPFGRPRQPGSIARFIALPPTYLPDERFEISGNYLFHPSDAHGDEDVVYLHQWYKLPK